MTPEEREWLEKNSKDIQARLDEVDVRVFLESLSVEFRRRWGWPNA